MRAALRGFLQRLGSFRRMHIRANIAQMASTRSRVQRIAHFGLVTIRMIRDLLHRVRELAMYAFRAFIQEEMGGADQLIPSCGNELTHLIIVRINQWVAPQPSSVYFHMSKPAKIMVVVIPLGAPGSAKLCHLFLTHLP